MFEGKSIIDISQPVDQHSAVFPGDQPFHREIMVSHVQSQVMNLTRFTMSPHVGTHADAPGHIQGDLDSDHDQRIGAADLSFYMGDAFVVDAAPFRGKIYDSPIRDILDPLSPCPKRILFKTQEKLNYTIFSDRYAYFSVELVQYLAEKGVILIGIDTPSVDHTASKTLEVHHALHQAGMVWLENLDLTHAAEGHYTLVALPLKMMELEASPVRAVLIANS